MWIGAVRIVFDWVVQSTTLTVIANDKGENEGKETGIGFLRGHSELIGILDKF